MPELNDMVDKLITPYKSDICYILDLHNLQNDNNYSQQQNSYVWFLNTYLSYKKDNSAMDF